MKTHFIQPYDSGRNLGKAYNEAMAMIPDGDSACLMDYDTMLLTSDAMFHVSRYAEMYPDAVLTCYTNRIHQLSPQLYGSVLNEDPDMRNHIRIAEAQKQHLYNVTAIDIMSGFLMVVPKKVWQLHPFDETIGLLGVDSAFRQSLVNAGVPILRMEGIYAWHSYRLLQGVKDKTHLI